jgi:pantothenate synthetase
MIEDENARVVDVLTLAKSKLRCENIEPEYLKIVDCNTMAPVTDVIGSAQIVAAVNVGSVRLIDTMRIEK